MTLEPGDVLLARQPREGLAVASEGELVVGLEKDLTLELLREGLAREFINKVQALRKAADLELTRRLGFLDPGAEPV